MGNLKGLIEKGLAQVGYVEKASNKDLDSKTGNPGDANYTKFSRDVNNVGLAGCQAQPWCCTFAFWQELMEFGKDLALIHWNMTPKTYVGYNCFQTYNAFKTAGKVGMTPKLGAITIFNFSHAGRVVRTYSEKGVQYFDCLEGNTGAGTTNRNGGETMVKKRPWNDPTVKGFCYVDYAEEKPEPPVNRSGWVQDKEGWKFYLDNDRCVRNDWYLYNGRWAWFDGAGNAVNNTWVEYKGKWYAFGEDCYMKTSEWFSYKGKDYYLDSNGIMATDSYVKSKEPGNTKYYYVDKDGIYDPSRTIDNPNGIIAL